MARLEGYICAAEARLGDGGSLRLATADLLVTGELVVALDDPALAALKASRGESWGARLRRFLRRAPGREDMATAYLGWAFAGGDERAMAEVAAQLLAHDADSPVGLWYSGAAMMAEPETAAAGFGRMRRALALGLEKRMPVDAGLAERIRAAPVVE